MNINGDSQTVENRLDVDVPLGIHLFGRELHTGGYISRTELLGDVQDGLQSNHLYMFNGRLVMDLLGKLWKVKWLGLGGTYFRGADFDGWAIGADVRFKF